MPASVLRILTFQPRAHYRIPIAVTVKMTFNFLPISTAIGFIANLLGYNQWNSTEERREEFHRILGKSKIGVLTSYDTIEIDNMYTFRNPDAHPDPNTGRPGVDPLTVYNIRNVVNVIYVDGELRNRMLEIIDDRGIIQDKKYVGPLNVGRAEDILTYVDIKTQHNLEEIPKYLRNHPIIINDPLESILKKYNFYITRINPIRHVVLPVDIDLINYNLKNLRINLVQIPAIFRIEKIQNAIDNSKQKGKKGKKKQNTDEIIYRRQNYYIKAAIFTDYLPTDADSKPIVKYEKLLYDGELGVPVCMFDLKDIYEIIGEKI
ncbi:MAG: CRISPR-associated protein Cas5 [Candidatus Micrarchaeota archaeon]|nr:CRISPR-associated protein Cas5 [Candidatus Micrarchaeota archaeon]